MDRRHDFKCHQRQCSERARQCCRSQPPPFSAECRGQNRTFCVSFQNPQPYNVTRRRHPKMIPHRYLDEGRDVKQFVLFLADTGEADLVRTDGQRVGVNFAEGVADFLDQHRKRVIGAIAEIDRQRIERVAEQSRIAQQQHPAAGEVNAVSVRAAPSVAQQR